MNSKYLDKLEYNKILEMLEGFVKTYLGKNLCRRLNPSTNVSFLLEQTNQALGLIYKKEVYLFLLFLILILQLKILNLTFL